MSGERCTRCGSAGPVAHGHRECIVSGSGAEATTTWALGLCQSCAREALVDDRSTTLRLAPVKGVILGTLGLGLCAAALIMLTEPGWDKLWSLPFAFLGLPAAIQGLGLLVTLPFAVRRLGGALRRLENDAALSDDDRDLLVHLEAHRVLDALCDQKAEAPAELTLPELADADPENTSYSLRRPP